MAATTRWTIVDIEQLPQVPCPCGTSRRALLDTPSFPGSIHRTEISTDAKPHYHRQSTETYYVLQCDADAQIELDGQRFPLRPGMCVVIPPGVVHRAIGHMSILNIVLPKFDPADEVLVDG
jgi:mannose-6-phosphate isomerase-like protein (cupin superfamily)